MAADHKELCDRLLFDTETTDSDAIEAACIIKEQAALIQQKALEYVSLFDQCSAALARVAELEESISEWRADFKAQAARIAELETACKTLERARATDPVCVKWYADQFDADQVRIAELEKERDALKADAERWRFSGTMFFRMMSPDMGGNHDWVANGRGVGRGNTLNAAIDARIAALQAEKETR